MRVEDLLSPGAHSNSQKLRVEVAKAISTIQVAAAVSGGTSPHAAQLQAFFQDAAAKVSAYVEAAPLAAPMAAQVTRTAKSKAAVKDE